MIAGTELRFDPASHVYTLADGSRVPSVTQILRDTGVSVDFDAIGAISGAHRDAIELKRALGTALHSDIHAFDEGDLDWSTVDARVGPYLNAWLTFRANHPHLTPVARERRVYHACLRYAGTLDGIFVGPTGERVLVDVKTGDPTDAGARYQLAAYQLAYETDPAVPPINERWTVQLCPDRTVPYLVETHSDYRDFATWHAIVATYYAQAARRRAV